MFMFRKKESTVSTTAGLQKEAQKFQSAVAEINANYKPSQVDIALVEGVASKYGVASEYIAGAFRTFLKNNALRAVRRIKANSDYTILHLEQAANSYGYELDDLSITYFSVE